MLILSAKVNRGERIMTKFVINSIVATNGVLDSVSHDDICSALKRYEALDWGDICDEDKEENNLSLERKGMLLGSYRSTEGVKFWVITDPGHKTTTVLLPCEY